MARGLILTRSGAGALPDTWAPGLRAEADASMPQLPTARIAVAAAAMARVAWDFVLIEPMSAEAHDAAAGHAADVAVPLVVSHATACWATSVEVS